jgi:hypothetical protein
MATCLGTTPIPVHHFVPLGPPSRPPIGLLLDARANAVRRLSRAVPNVFHFVEEVWDNSFWCVLREKFDVGGLFFVVFFFTFGL